ncbi:MFS transporter [Pseudogracilibacillus auburnensis]|uniref:Putative MFS family arabinose efflux permease n=1 Tax=Pseudogracilibacillus auburnensis TaxID=1494959 RepID=A0A2V3VH42_9BACI|nr:MFS transporter [Pseudogracilibacillus auburnensis]MBO1002443.1 MFS transporter [Pseudogracilibacillus auburnensis]PXW80930.1 putative MFS family arabinose efflux permease [Pseudogracilibacillus auburnensis]
MGNIIKSGRSTQPNYSLLTVILFWCGLVIVASNYLTIPLMTIFSQVFDASIAKVAWTGSAFSLFYAIGSLFSGPISDRYGRKKVILIGLLLLTVITFLLPLVSHLTWIIILRSIQGLTAASFAPVALSYVVDLFPTEKVVTTIGFISSGFLMAGIVGQIFSDFFSQKFGWQSVFYFSGGIYLFTALIVAFSLPKSMIQNVDSNLRTMFYQFRTILVQKKLILCYVITITLLLTFVAVYTVLGDFLSEKYHVDERGILSIRMLGIIGMLFAPVAGLLTRRYGLFHVLRGALSLAVIGVALLGISFNLIFAVCMSIVFVTGIALTVPTLISVVGELGGENRGAAVSFYAFILFIGTSLGPIIAVLLLKFGSYVIAFLSLALLLSVGLFLSFLLKGEDEKGRGEKGNLISK